MKAAIGLYLVLLAAVGLGCAPCTKVEAPQPKPAQPGTVSTPVPTKTGFTLMGMSTGGPVAGLMARCNNPDKTEWHPRKVRLEEWTEDFYSITTFGLQQSAVTWSDKNGTLTATAYLLAGDRAGILSSVMYDGATVEHNGKRLYYQGQAREAVLNSGFHVVDREDLLRLSDDAGQLLLVHLLSDGSVTGFSLIAEQAIHAPQKDNRPPNRGE